MVNYKKAGLKLSEDLIKELETKYQAEKDAECAELWNALSEVLVEQSVPLQNAIYVMELMLHQLVTAGYNAVMGNVMIPEGNIPVSKGISFKTPRSRDKPPVIATEPVDREHAGCGNDRPSDMGAGPADSPPSSIFK
mgnify:CR=1|jgi:hypothetical protein